MPVLASATSSGPEAPAFLRLLGHDLRWQLVGELVRSDHRVCELVDTSRQPANLVSYHLAQLRRNGIVRERRSSADARDIYYSIDLEHLQDLLAGAATSLHPGLTAPAAAIVPLSEKRRRKNEGTPSRVLFLCTANSARSQMAEALLRHLSRGAVETASAGSEPTRLHPIAIDVMRDMGLDISRQRAKPMGEFAAEDFDYVISLCDKVREVCPAFPGDPQRIHWSFPDPALTEGSKQDMQKAFKKTARELATRIRYLIALIERQH